MHCLPCMHVQCNECLSPMCCVMIVQFINKNNTSTSCLLSVWPVCEGKPCASRAHLVSGAYLGEIGRYGFNLHNANLSPAVLRINTILLAAHAVMRKAVYKLCRD